uniref:Cysteine protease n=1 Tax=Blomia tropicalis TaxID=40697 RepID=CYSP_BLOTA|nr:RecName: Full=Cysteine protease; AltName: Allergen=Blo t 1; Flags: Precursor [Blomia tropicalis]AAQ24541.1 Blo t 1 allergen [Blomia tropicalis]
MKFLLVAALCALVAIGSCKPTREEIKTFEQFKKVFGKVYRNAEEEARREHHFKEQLKWVEEHNGIDGVEYAINEYSDMSEQEFSFHLSGGGLNFTYMKMEAAKEPLINTYGSLPQNFDWRQKARLTRIRQQGSCGSCWAFAAAGVAESLYSIQKQQSIELSEQELVDCTYNRYDSSYQCNGCGSGYSTEAFKYMIRTGLVEEENYPYNMRTQWCNPDVEGQRYHVSGYQQLRYQSSDEDVMYTIQQHGPVVIYMHGSNNYFRNLGNGVLRGVAYNDAYTDHAVILVGWGTVQGVDYWIIRNSWGTGWGNGGYGYVERGHNSLGINNFVTYATL